MPETDADGRVWIFQQIDVKAHFHRERIFTQHEADRAGTRFETRLEASLQRRFGDRVRVHVRPGTYALGCWGADAVMAVITAEAPVAPLVYAAIKNLAKPEAKKSARDTFKGGPGMYIAVNAPEPQQKPSHVSPPPIIKPKDFGRWAGVLRTIRWPIDEVALEESEEQILTPGRDALPGAVETIKVERPRKDLFVRIALAVAALAFAFIVGRQALSNVDDTAQMKGALQRIEGRLANIEKEMSARPMPPQQSVTVRTSRTGVEVQVGPSISPQR